LHIWKLGSFTRCLYGWVACDIFERITATSNELIEPYYNLAIKFTFIRFNLGHLVYIIERTHIKSNASKMPYICIAFSTFGEVKNTTPNKMENLHETEQDFYRFGSSPTTLSQMILSITFLGRDPSTTIQRFGAAFTISR